MSRAVKTRVVKSWAPVSQIDATVNLFLVKVQPLRIGSDLTVRPEFGSIRPPRVFPNCRDLIDSVILIGQIQNSTRRYVFVA
jgi:hypothetical protein